jgi:predicted GNAT family N-acyltransferase
MRAESPRGQKRTGSDPPIVVREVAGVDDEEEVLRIRDEVFVHEQQLTDDARHDPDDRHSIHFLAEIDGQAVGTGRITMFGRESQVAWVAVRPEWRGSGVGTAVMDAIIERSRQEGADHILLNAQTHAIGFYEQLGFETVGTEFVMGGIGHRVMVLRL